MSEWAAAVLIGFVQGATEFLPVSSTAHLALLSHWAGWGPFPLTLEMAAHLGTLGAVLIYFAHDWIDLLRGRQRPLLWSLLIATVVTAGLAALFEPYFERAQQPWLMATTLAVFGLLLWRVDAVAEAQRGPDYVPDRRESVWLGLAQALALLPGISRSGILITLGRQLRFTKEQAARFAFLLSAPIIMLSPAAALLRGSEVLRFDAQAWGVMASSFVFGWLAIAGLMTLVKRTGYHWFAFYRLAIAALILITLR